MVPVLPAHALEVGQAHEDFVNKRGGLQGMAGALANHIAMRSAAKLFVNEGDDILQRRLVPLIPGGQQVGKFVVSVLQARRPPCSSGPQCYHERM